MRLSIALSLLLSTRNVAAFVIQPIRSSTISATTRTTWLPSSSSDDDSPAAAATESKEKDDYDDWYADFDPAEYENLNNSNGNGSSQGGGYSSGGSNGSSSGPARRTGGGGGGSNHDYTRDESDSSNVDLDTVNHLISERLVFRKTGQFEQADAIRDELTQKHGVLVRDKDRSWRSGGSLSGSGRNWESGKERRGGREGSGGRGGGDRRPKKTFGPNGHDYTLAGDAGPSISPLAEVEIHRLMAERLECKLNRNFDRADQIQEELFQAAVLVTDGRKQWRADGKSFEGFNTRKYQESEYSSGSPDTEEIEALVHQRANAKSERAYKQADAIREELRDRFDVQLDDRLQQWSLGGGFGPANQRGPKVFEEYTKSASSTTPDDADDIKKLVEQRDAARADREFDKADQIRDELLERNVYINDRLRQWAVGESFSEERKERQERGWSRRGGGTISEEDEATILDLLQERDEYKRERDFGKADRIRDRLQDDFQLSVDDRAKEWHVVTNEYAMSSSCKPMSAETQQLIHEKVSERAIAKLNRDYETADAIRDELMDEYKVNIDDRVKEWIKLEGEEGVEDDSDEVVEVVEDDAAEEEVVEDDEIEASGDVTNSLDEDALDKLTIPQLKERLRAASLPVSGRKSELIERLISS